MTKRDLLSLLRFVEDDEDIVIVIDDGAEHLDELEVGSVLEIQGTVGHNVNASHVLFALPR